MSALRSPFAFALRRWPLTAGLISAAMLLTAHLFERAGYAPCALCLRQREVYWAALVVAAAGVAVTVSRPVIGRWPGKLAIVLLGAIFLFGAGLAAYHAGVEWRWWPGPASCTGVGTGPVTLEALTDALSRPVRMAMCDQAAWRWLGLSMAGWNALVSLALAMLSALALRRKEAALG